MRPNEGDAYPLGALPVGTAVHCVERTPGKPFHFMRAAGVMGTILRKFDDNVVVLNGKKEEWAFNQNCMATVGRVSNVGHADVKLGSHQRARELGYRPRSGLWQRKSGRHGRKIKPIPPMRFMSVMNNTLPIETLSLTMKIPNKQRQPIYGN